MSAAATTAPGPTATTDPRTARRRLDAALWNEASAGRATPCLTDPEAFTSDWPRERVRAVQRCRACPVVRRCRDYADAAGEAWHVWGGVDLSEANDRDRTDIPARRGDDEAWPTTPMLTRTTSTRKTSMT